MECSLALQPTLPRCLSRTLESPVPSCLLCSPFPPQSVKQGARAFPQGLLAPWRSGDIWAPNVNVPKICCQLWRLGNNLGQFGVFPAEALPRSTQRPFSALALSVQKSASEGFYCQKTQTALTGLISWQPLKCKWNCTNVSQTEWHRPQMPNEILIGALKRNPQSKLVWETPHTLGELSCILAY